MKKLSQEMMSSSSYYLVLMKYILILITSCTYLGESDNMNPSFNKANSQFEDSLKLLFNSKLTVDFEFDTLMCDTENSNIGDGSEIHLIYFTSYACVNCRKFENYAFFKEENKSIITRSFQLHVLFVDYPPSRSYGQNAINSGQHVEEVKSAATNSQLQIRLSKSGHQPFICMVNSNCDLVDYYKGNLFSALEFKQWLKSFLYQ